MTAQTYRIADLPARIAAKITTDSGSECWLWQNSCDEDGYGRVKWDGKLRRVHRVVYGLLVEPIPAGLTIDHVKNRGCAHKNCCWPGHLEPVTRGDNIRRGTRAQSTRTHCPQNHPYNEANTYIHGRKRHCRTCNAEKNRRYRARKKASA